MVEHLPRGLVAALNSLHAEAFETRVFDETEWNWQEQLAIIRRPPPLHRHVPGWAGRSRLLHGSGARADSAPVSPISQPNKKDSPIGSPLVLGPSILEAQHEGLPHAMAGRTHSSNPPPPATGGGEDESGWLAFDGDGCLGPTEEVTALSGTGPGGAPSESPATG